MARKVELEDLAIDFTSMIDIIFQLIIFFLLMPFKGMEGVLDSYLPNEGSAQQTTKNPPETVFNIILRSEPAGEPGKIATRLTFNNVPMGRDIITLAPETIAQMSSSAMRQALKEEAKGDEEQLHPDRSTTFRDLLAALEKAARGSEKGHETSILLDANPRVPFKVVLAVLNCIKGGKYTKLKFIRPPDEIWKAD